MNGPEPGRQDELPDRDLMRDGRWLDEGHVDAGHDGRTTPATETR